MALSIEMRLRNSCLSMHGNGHSNHWMVLCWPLCALATFLEHLAKQMVLVCECIWHGFATPCGQPALCAQVLTILAFICWEILERSGYIFKGRTWAKSSAVVSLVQHFFQNMYCHVLSRCYGSHAC